MQAHAPDPLADNGPVTVVDNHPYIKQLKINSKYIDLKLIAIDEGQDNIEDDSDEQVT